MVTFSLARVRSTRRAKIVDAMVSLVKTIDTKSAANEDGFTSYLHENVSPTLIMWDQITTYPTVCITSGKEDTEYLAGRERIKTLEVNVRVFVQASDTTAQAQLEAILSDIETLIETTSSFTYTDINGDIQRVTDCSIESINTDEGVLSPLGIGEMFLTIKYL